MPFTSQKQRGLFYAAKNNPEIGRERGIKPSAVNKMIDEDKPGKLPRSAAGQGAPAGPGKLATFGALKGLRK